MIIINDSQSREGGVKRFLSADVGAFCISLRITSE